MPEILVVSMKKFINVNTGAEADQFSCGPPEAPLGREWVLAELYHGRAPPHVSHDTLCMLKPWDVEWWAIPTKFGPARCVSLCVCEFVSLRVCECVSV